MQRRHILRLTFPAIFVVALLAILIPAIVLAQDQPTPANLPPNLVGVEPGDPAPPLEPKYQPPSDGKDSEARPAALDAPTGLASTATTCTSITMQWDDVFLAQSYRLDYKEASSETWLFGGTVATSPTSNPSITVSNLTRNTSYHFRAIAWLGGYGDPSPTVTVRTAVTVTITGTGAGSSSSKSAAESQASAAAIADYNAKVAAHEGTVIGAVPTPSVSVSSSSSSQSSSGTTQISRSATVWAVSGAEAAAKAQATAAYDNAAKAVSGYTSHTSATVTATSLGARDQAAQGSSTGAGAGTGDTESAAETAAQSAAETASENAATGSNPRAFSHSVTSTNTQTTAWEASAAVTASYLLEKQGEASGGGIGVASSASAATAIARSNAESNARAAAIAKQGINERGFSYTETSSDVSGPGAFDQYFAHVIVSVSYTYDEEGTSTGSGTGTGATESAATSAAVTAAEADARSNASDGATGFSYTTTSSSASGTAFSSTVSVSSTYTYDVEESGYEATASGTASWTRTTVTWNATATASAQVRFNCPDDPTPTPTPSPTTPPCTNFDPAFPTTETGVREIPENEPSGTEFGSPVAADDRDQNDTLTYSLSGTDAPSFTISSAGQLSSAKVFDYEVKSSYTVTVSVRDSKDADCDPDTATDATITVTVNIEDVNEPPIFDDGATASRSVSEDAATGTNIGSAVSATDPEDDTLTYDLTGTDASSFSIVTSSGQLQTSAALDADTKSSYSVTVRVHDGKDSDGNADTTWDDTISVTINVTKPTPPPTPDPDPTPTPTPTLPPPQQTIPLPVTPPSPPPPAPNPGPNTPILTIKPHDDDKSGITEGSKARFVITADKKLTAELTLSLSITQTPTGANYLNTTGRHTATFPSGYKSLILVVSTVSDGTDEPNGSVITQVLPTNDYRVTGPPPHNVAEASIPVSDDDDTPAPRNVRVNGHLDANNRITLRWDAIDGATYNVRYVVETCKAEIHNTPGWCRPSTGNLSQWGTVNNIMTETKTTGGKKVVEAKLGIQNVVEKDDYRIEVQAQVGTDVSPWNQMNYTLVAPTRSLASPADDTLVVATIGLDHFQRHGRLDYAVCNPGSTAEALGGDLVIQPWPTGVDLDDITDAIDLWEDTVVWQVSGSSSNIVQTAGYETTDCKHPNDATRNLYQIMFLDGAHMKRVCPALMGGVIAAGCHFTQATKHEGDHNTGIGPQTLFILDDYGSSNALGTAGVKWTDTGTGARGGPSCTHLQEVLVHEAGHAFGLTHRRGITNNTLDPSKNENPTTNALMRTGYDPTNQLCTPQVFDVSAMMAIYQSRVLPAR